MSAPTARAEWLKTQYRFAVAQAPAVLALWAGDAADTSQQTALVAEADAAAEAARQLAQMAMVRGRDVVLLAGLHPGLPGRTVRLPYAGRFGHGATVDMLVIRARLNLSAGTTEIEGEVLL